MVHYLVLMSPERGVAKRKMLRSGMFNGHVLCFEGFVFSFFEVGHRIMMEGKVIRINMVDKCVLSLYIWTHSFSFKPEHSLRQVEMSKVVILNKCILSVLNPDID